MKRLLTIIALVAFIVSFFSATPAVAGGFDQFGYNRQARIFDGTASGWCLQRSATPDCLGNYSNDHLVMKWNAEWDRGNTEGWSDTAGYSAWINNEWNGNVPGGSGFTEIVKIIWVGDCTGPNFRPGGYCIWGAFEVVMDQGTDPDHHHAWYAQANPSGYGGAP